MIWLICRETHLNAIVDQETLNLQAAYRAPANEVSCCSLPLHFTESTLLHNLSFDKPSGILNARHWWYWLMLIPIWPKVEQEKVDSILGTESKHLKSVLHFTKFLHLDFDPVWIIYVENFKVRECGLKCEGIVVSISGSQMPHLCVCVCVFHHPMTFGFRTEPGLQTNIKRSS